MVVTTEYRKTKQSVEKGMKAASREIDDGKLLVKVLNAFMRVEEILDGKEPNGNE